VTTLAGGPVGHADGQGAAARFNTPRGVAVDPAGNVFVADASGHRIRKVAPDGTVTTVAGSGQRGFGDGPGPEARFHEPFGVAVGPDGTLYVADANNNRVRKIFGPH
jgi:DNA-binding beta-propeller fold protein YncE